MTMMLSRYDKSFIVFWVKDTSSKSGFFLQAEDGIRDVAVTGVQTCALPICLIGEEERRVQAERGADEYRPRRGQGVEPEIGRASCRERGERSGVDGSLKKKKET